MNSCHVLPKWYNNIIQVRNNIVPIVIRDDYLLYGIQRAMGTQGVSKFRIIEPYMYHTLVSTRYCRAKSTILYSSIWYTIYLPENINRRVLCKYNILCLKTENLFQLVYWCIYWYIYIYSSKAVLTHTIK